MLRFGLVLLLAASALAAPGYAPSYDYANLILKDNAGVQKNIGAANHLTDKVFSYFDGGDSNVYILTAQELINELAAKSDQSSRALALGQAVASSLALATGVPGDVCIAAGLNDAFPTGNYRQAASKFINHIANNLNLLTKFVRNSQSARFASGPRSNCQGAGRVYNFEGTWSKILDSASAANSGNLNEQYCAAKRLYYAFNVRSNNFAAVLTAVSTSPVVAAIEASYGPLINYLNALAANRNVEQAASAASKALYAAAQRV